MPDRPQLAATLDVVLQEHEDEEEVTCSPKEVR